MELQELKEATAEKETTRKQQGVTLLAEMSAAEYKVSRKQHGVTLLAAVSAGSDKQVQTKTKTEEDDPSCKLRLAFFLPLGRIIA